MIKEEHTSFKSERFASDENDIRPLVSSFHDVVFLCRVRVTAICLATTFGLLPARPTTKEQTRSLIRSATDVPRAHHALPIRDCKVKKTPTVFLSHVLLAHSLLDQRIDPLNRLQYGFPQNGVSEAALSRVAVRMMPC